MDSVASLNSALVGRYRIDREIGRGGMATVYLARDQRHERNVALKVLNPELGAVLGVERFLSEIRVTANLQHPNLLPLFDSGEVAIPGENGGGRVLFYVMPFVEGESLRARLERESQLPIDQAVHIATAIAGALDYAHRRGVIHRDLKPENILLHEGEPLIADFGIALAVSNAGGGRITQTGISLGTPQYMSPEQATGDRVIDGRSDIYSLGAVLYEMLTGEPPHTGPTAQAIVARVMTEQARPVGITRRNVPVHVESSVARALEKLPADRFQTAEQFRAALAEPAGGNSTLAAARVRSRNSLGRYLPWAIAAASLGMLGAAALRWPTRVAPRVVRFTEPIPNTTQIEAARSWLAVAPSGSPIVYVAGGSGNLRMFARGLAEDSSRVVPGTDGADGASFSPTGEWLLVHTVEGELLKVPSTGGAPVPLAQGVSSASWGAKDDIVFSRYTDRGLWHVSANGGEARRLPVTDTVIANAFGTRVSFLPSGDAVLFSATGSGLTSNQRMGVVTLDGAVKRFDVAGAFPQYVEPGYVIFSSASGQLSAAPFDERRREFTGRAIPVAQGVAVRTDGGPVFAVSRNGEVLVYLRRIGESRLAMVAEGGQATLLPGDARQFRHPRISPDGKRIVVEVDTPGGARDIWVYEIGSARPLRLTFDGRSSDPVWSPDGKRVAFAVVDSAGSAVHVFTIPSDGGGSRELLVGGPGSQWPDEWTRDGRTFVYDELPVGGPMRVAAVTGGVKRVLVSSPEYTARLATVSPDGRLIAYTSSETNRIEVYVRQLAEGATGRWEVSTSGGSQPVWSRDGKTLYYRDGQSIIAASISAEGSSISIKGQRVFAPDRYTLENTLNFGEMPDGRHLLMLATSGDAASFAVQLNWLEGVKAGLAAGRSR